MIINYGKKKVGLFLLFFLFASLFAYALDNQQENKLGEKNIPILKTDKKNLDTKDQVKVIETKQEFNAGNMKGFVQSFKANDGYLDFGLRLGYINGFTSFDFNHHVSELEYPFNNLLGGGNVSFGYMGLSLNIEMWGSLTGDAGWNLKDKDWNDDGEIYSDTRSKADMNAMIMDGNMRYDFYRYCFSEKRTNKGNMQTNSIKVGILGGYRYQRFGYDGFGIMGTSEEDTEEKIFTYKVKYYLPYLGLAMDAVKNCFGMNMSVKYAIKPHVRDQDFHVLRSLMFYGDYKDNANAFMYNFNLFWRFFKSWQFNLGADVSLIRLDGFVEEEYHRPGWDKEQSVDTKQFIYWTGLMYKF